MRIEDVPERVRERAVVQMLSTVAAVYAGHAGHLGARLGAVLPARGAGSQALPDPRPCAPARAAERMSAWSMVHDYDDVLLGGHTGHAAVLVPLAYAVPLAAGGRSVLLAQIVANEIAARVNMTVALGPLRGQMAAHVSIAAAAAARAKLERLDERAFAEALSLGLTYPMRPLIAGFLGSDAKTLCAAWPIRMGLESVDAIRAGLRGNVELLDQPGGFVATLAEVPMPEFLGGLSERWHLDTLCVKAYPGSAYLTPIVQAVLEITGGRAVSAEDVEEVRVEAPVFAAGMERLSALHRRGPDTPGPTLSFSVAYNVACALLAGALAPEHHEPGWVTDERVWKLAERVHVVESSRLTLRALLGDLPVGAALARASRSAAARFAVGLARWVGDHRSPLGRLAARAWIAGRVAGAPRAPRIPDLRHAKKSMCARVEIRFSDGASRRAEVDVPRGFVGSDDPGAARVMMRAKLEREAGAVLDGERAAALADRIERIEALSAGELGQMIEAACVGETDAARAGDRVRIPA